MNKVILIKKNGTVTESIRNQYISSKPYMEENENIFKDIINQKNIEETPSYIIDKIRKDVSRSVTQIKSNDFLIICNIYMMIRESNSKEDLIKIFKSLINRYKVVNSKYINEYISNNFDVFASIFIKKIMISYYTNIILSLDNDKIEKLYALKNKNISSEELLNIIEKPENKLNNKTFNKMAENVLLHSIDIVYDATRKHLCWENCKNCSPKICPKINDEVKQKIDKYDFITDGYQILNKDGKIDTFVVTNCKNYIYKKERVLTPEEKRNAIKIKEGLEIMFFDATNLKEARKTEEEWIKNKQLFKNRGKESYKKIEE